MYWYVLFVRTGQEYKVEQFIKKQRFTDAFIPFIPLHEKIYKISGVVKKELSLLFPSYVFIESELSSQEFIKRISSLMYISRDIVRILKYSESDIAIRESEKKSLLSLCNDEHCIESSIGIMQGDRVQITDGPLKGRENIVKKMDRHKRQAWIEMEIMRETHLISVALEIVQKINVTVDNLKPKDILSKV